MMKNLIPWRNKQVGEGRPETAPPANLRSELEPLFENFWRDPFGLAGWPLAAAEGPWGPAVDLSESESELTVRAEVPGIDPKDIDVQVTGNQLVITGEKKESGEKREGNWYHRESRFGAFRRAVPLPEGVDRNKVHADYANGVLTVRMEKTGASQARRIEVKSK